MSAVPEVPNRPTVECRCEGGARVMGEAQGRALQQKIVGVWGRLSELEAFRLAQPAQLPYEHFLKFAERNAAQALVPALERSSPEMLARLNGIAAGAGLPLESLCLLNALEASLSSTEGNVVPAPIGACSAVAVRGSGMSEQETIIAHNFDYVPLLQPFYTLRESRPRNGFRSLEFLVAPQAGAVDGVNEKGLCITLNYAFVTDIATPAPLISMAIADALANCATVPEAAERIARQSRWGAGMLMLADAAGDIASLELSNTLSTLRRPKAGQEWLVFTNVFNCPETCALQVADTAVYSSGAPLPLRGKPVLQWHAERACRLEEILQARSPRGPVELAAVMADHGANNQPDGSSPCVHTDYWRTTACLQWFPARRSARVSYSAACQAEYVEFGL